MQRQQRNPLRTTVKAALAITAALTTLQVQAQSQPWYVGAQQRFEHQTNLFRAPSNEVSSTLSSTSLIGGLDMPIGRQRLYGNIALSTNRYSGRSDLNYEGHAARLGLNWETAGNLSGNVDLDSSETLADFNPLGLTSVQNNNKTSTQGARGTVRLGGMVNRMSFELGGATRKTRFDNIQYAARNLNINELFGGVRYRPAGALVLGVGLRATRGEYPNFRAVSGEGFDRDNIDFTADWPISGASLVNARLSFGRDRYDTIAVSNFSGVTGEVQWRWQPTGRSTVTTKFLRTSGDETSISTVPGQAAYATAANRVSNSLGSQVDYDLTGKIKLRGTVTLLDSTAINLQSLATSGEFVTTLGVGATWEATRAIRVGCDLTHHTRSNRATAPGFDASIVGCFGEFVLR